MSPFLPLLLALSALAQPTKGAQHFDQLSELPGVITSPERRKPEDIWALKEGQVLNLATPEIQLTYTMAIPLSNVFIDGGETMTVVRCPPEGSAFAVQGTNVTFARLKIVDCANAPAIAVHRIAVPHLDRGRMQTIYGSKNSNEEWNHDVFIESCHFENNTSSEGGAILAESARLYIKKSNFSRNNAVDGGAVYATKSFLEIISSNFSSNVADGSGGALRVIDSAMTARDCWFSANSGQYGGALNVGPSVSLVASKVTFADNHVDKDGGGISLWRGSTLSMSDSLFYRNQARSGAALRVIASNGTLANLTFADNVAALSGGGIQVARGAQLRSTYREGRSITFRNNSAKYGGGVRCDHCVLEFQGETNYEGNTADEGGGICVFVAEIVKLNCARFHRNVATAGGGGAIKVSDCQAFALGSSSSCQTSLTSNSAPNGGAIWSMRGSTIKLTNVEFSDNSADRDGGAISMGSFTTLSVARAQMARSGKGNRAKVAATKSTITIANATFVDNTAGDRGGAIRMIDKAELHSNYSASQSVTFRNNSAAYGGAVYGDDCVLDLQGETRYEGNSASEGGAVCLFSARSVRLDCGRFHRNMATSGGAIKFANCKDCAVGSYTSCVTSFKSNVAVDGGAVYLESGSYKIQCSRFESNRAAASDNIPTVVQWTGEQKRVWKEQAVENQNCTDCDHGRGGAIFVGSQESTESIPVDIFLSNLYFSKNSAVIGGGCYLETPHSDKRPETHHWCEAGQKSEPDCSRVLFDRLQLKKNIASLAGGGIFMSGSQNPGLFCSRNPSHTTGVDGTYGDCFKFVQNEIQTDGYGPDLATDVSALRWKSETFRVEELPDRTKLSVTLSSVSFSTDISSLSIDALLQDALNQTVTTGRGSNLSVIQKSNLTKESTTTTLADKGVIRIDLIPFLVAGTTYKIMLRTIDYPDLSTVLIISTTSCAEDEIEGPSGRTCHHCSAQLYTFGLEEDCLPCEAHAICNLTTGLVPENGYWHSTPLSPLMRKCPVKNACSWEGRTESLISYHKDHERLIEEMRRFYSNRTNVSLSDYEEYKQCRDGYAGPMCGECESDYGHDSNGECVHCAQSLAITRLLTTLNTLALFIVVSFKLFLEINGVREDVAFRLLQEKRRSRVVLDQVSVQTHSGSASNSERGRSQGERDDVLCTGVDSARHSVAERSATVARDEAPSTVEIGPAPSLERSGNIEEPLLDPKDTDVSEEAVEAAGVLSETYNILFNYMQLNSVALFLDIDWKGAVRQLLSLQTAVGRLLKIAVYPLDCCFPDRGKDVGVPNSILVVAYRFTLPLFFIAFYSIVILLWGWTGGARENRSKYEVDLIPPIRLVFSVVYFAFCIDLISDSVKVLNCVRMHPVQQNHRYARFEILRNESVWAEDTSVTCWENDHLYLTICAAVGLVASLSFVVFMIVVLRRGRKQWQLKKPRFLLNYGFLYLKYRQEGMALYWESVITARRMLLAGICVHSFGRETTSGDVGLLSTIIVVAIVLHEIVQPFDHTDSRTTFPSYAGWTLKQLGAARLSQRWVLFNQYITLNSMEGASLFMSLSLFLGATSINGDDVDDVQAYILLTACFLLNSLFTLFMFYRIWYGFHHYLDVIARDRSMTFKGDEDPEVDNNTWLFAKVWVLFSRPQERSSEETNTLLPSAELA